MKDLFSPEADNAIAKAFAWLAERDLYQSEPIVQGRLYRHGMVLSDEEQRILRCMAEHSGWIERGGLAIREASDYQTGGDVIGRTQWIGQPEWASGFGYGKAEIQNVVEKAIAGQRLASKQTVLFQVMLDVLADAQSTVVPF